MSNRSLGSWRHKVAIGDIAAVTAGYWGSGERSTKASVPVEVLRNGDIAQHGLRGTAASRWFSDREADRAHLSAGDVVMTSSGDCGKLALIRQPGLFASNFVKRIRISSSDVLAAWLHFVLQSPVARSHLEPHIGGTTIQNLKKGYFADPFLVVPPLPEQQRIVEILEEQLSRLDAALDSVRVVREKAAQFRRSLLHAAFTGALSGHDSATGQLPVGWRELTLRDVIAPPPGGQLITQGKSPKCDPSATLSESEWGVLTTTSIQSGAFRPEEHKRLPASIEPDPSIEVAAGDLLVTRAGPRSRCGVACLVRATRPRLLLSDKMYRFRVDAAVAHPEFVEFALLEPSAQQDINRLKTGTSESGLNLTQGRFLELRIPIPPLETQDMLVATVETHLSRVDASLVLADAVEKRSAALRRSLLHAAFTGRLTEQWRKHANV